MGDTRTIAAMRIMRLLRIWMVALRHGLDEFVLAHERVRWMRPWVIGVLFWRDLETPRAVRLRRALEDLGPIFVKFGQVLSTRRDLLPPDVADELARLQDRVPPFPSEEVIATLQRVYRKPIDQVFRRFDRKPRASASVAQVHFAELPDGTPVAVKVLRPNIEHVIEHDLALMQTAAMLMERLWKEGKRLSSTRRSTMSSTSRARRRIAPSFAATSGGRRSCSCRKFIGTGPTLKCW